MPRNGSKNRYIAGDHLSVSDISGQKFLRSNMVFNWKHQLVDRLTEFEEKHPQLLIRGRKEQIGVTDGTRTQGDDPALLNPPITASDFI